MNSPRLFLQVAVAAMAFTLLSCGSPSSPGVETTGQRPPAIGTSGANVVLDSQIGRTTEQTGPNQFDSTFTGTVRNVGDRVAQLVEVTITAFGVDDAELGSSTALAQPELVPPNATASFTVRMTTSAPPARIEHGLRWTET